MRGRAAARRCSVPGTIIGDARRCTPPRACAGCRSRRTTRPPRLCRTARCRGPAPSPDGDGPWRARRTTGRARSSNERIGRSNAPPCSARHARPHRTGRARSSCPTSRLHVYAARARPAAGQTAIERDLDRVVVAHGLGQRQGGGAPARIELSTPRRNRGSRCGGTPPPFLPAIASRRLRARDRSVCACTARRRERRGQFPFKAPTTNSCSRVWPSAGSIA